MNHLSQSFQTIVFLWISTLFFYLFSFSFSNVQNLPTKKEFINIDISNNTFKEKVLHDNRLDGIEFNQILRNSYAKCFFHSIFKLIKLEKSCVTPKCYIIIFSKIRTVQIEENQFLNIDTPFFLRSTRLKATELELLSNTVLIRQHEFWPNSKLLIKKSENGFRGD